MYLRVILRCLLSSVSYLFSQRLLHLCFAFTVVLTCLLVYIYIYYIFMCNYLCSLLVYSASTLWFLRVCVRVYAYIGTLVFFRCEGSIQWNYVLQLCNVPYTLICYYQHWSLFTAVLRCVQRLQRDIWSVDWVVAFWWLKWNSAITVLFSGITYCNYVINACRDFLLRSVTLSFCDYWAVIMNNSEDKFVSF